MTLKFGIKNDSYWLATNQGIVKLDLNFNIQKHFKQLNSTQSPKPNQRDKYFKGFICLVDDK